jgi:hypothetical protein
MVQKHRTYHSPHGTFQQAQKSYEEILKHPITAAERALVRLDPRSLEYKILMIELLVSAVKETLCERFIIHLTKVTAAEARATERERQDEVYVDERRMERAQQIERERLKEKEEARIRGTEAELHRKIHDQIVYLNNQNLALNHKQDELKQINAMILPLNKKLAGIHKHWREEQRSVAEAVEMYYKTMQEKSMTPHELNEVKKIIGNLPSPPERIKRDPTLNADKMMALNMLHQEFQAALKLSDLERHEEPSAAKILEQIRLNKGKGIPKLIMLDSVQTRQRKDIEETLVETRKVKPLLEQKHKVENDIRELGAAIADATKVIEDSLKALDELAHKSRPDPLRPKR